MAAGMKLDRIDLNILSVLQRHGRITKAKLAEAVHLSPSAGLERLRRLERAGIVRGYSADIAVERLAPVSTIFVEITLDQHRAEDFARFETHIQGVPEVVECHALGGGVDYLLKMVARDIADYQAAIDALLAAEIGIGRYFTYVVTKPVKQAPLPLERLVESR